MILATILACGTVAQADGDEPGGPSLLQRWLVAEGDGADGLGAELEALGVPALRQALADWRPPPLEDDARELHFTTRCPDGYERSYFVALPPDFDPAQRHGLLVVLHGGVLGSLPEVALNFLQFWARHLHAQPEGRAWILVAPASEAVRTTVNAAWWRPGGRQIVRHTIAEVRHRFSIDDARVVLTGISDGGGGTFSLAFRSPYGFAGFIPVIGDPLIPITDDVTEWWSNLGGLRIQALTGGRDPLYPGRAMAAHFERGNKAGAEIDYRLFDEVGHEFPEPAAEIPRLLEECLEPWRWDPLPKRIDWISDLPETGRRAWLSIDATGPGGPKRAKKPRPIAGQSYRLDLGTRLPVLAPGRPAGEPRVERIEPSSPAEAMGVEVGDLLLELNGQPLPDSRALGRALAGRRAGDAIELAVERGGRRLELSGRFPPRPTRHTGRVQASWKPGLVQIRTRGVTRLTVWVAPDMLSRGKLTVKINGRPAFKGSVAPDPGLLLRVFRETGERACAYLARLELAVD